MATGFAISQVSTVTTPPPLRSFPTAARSFAPSSGPAATNSGPPAINPSQHVDAALNLVVLQFFDAQGDVEQSIPSQRQLQAYRQDAGQASTRSTLQLS